MKRLIEEIKGTGTFWLIDYSSSHNQFLYRGQSKSGANKDILISGGEYLSVPTYIEDFKIYKGNSLDEEIVFKRYKPRGGKKIFVAEENKGFKHFIVADRILTQENNYAYSETSIPIKREKPITTNDIQQLADKINNDIKNKRIQFVVDEYIETGEWEILE